MIFSTVEVVVAALLVGGAWVLLKEEGPKVVAWFKSFLHTETVDVQQAEQKVETEVKKVEDAVQDK